MLAVLFTLTLAISDSATLVSIKYVSPPIKEITVELALTMFPTSGIILVILPAKGARKIVLLYEAA
jgi:hypothetical protein